MSGQKFFITEMIALAVAESAVSSVVITQFQAGILIFGFKRTWEGRCHSFESLDFTGPWVHSCRLDPVSMVFSGTRVTRKR